MKLESRIDHRKPEVEVYPQRKMSEVVIASLLLLLNYNDFVANCRLIFFVKVSDEAMHHLIGCFGLNIDSLSSLTVS